MPLDVLCSGPSGARLGERSAVEAIEDHGGRLLPRVRDAERGREGLAQRGRGERRRWDRRRPGAMIPGMRRVVCKEIGPLDQLVVEDGEAPEPGEGQVLVDVRAAGVNFVDALFVQGRYQIKPPTPFTPGSEVAGVVSALGPGVEG